MTLQEIIDDPTVTAIHVRRRYVGEDPRATQLLVVYETSANPQDHFSRIFIRKLNNWFYQGETPVRRSPEELERELNAKAEKASS